MRGPLYDPLHRRLQPLRHLHDCSDCYRLERKLPGGSVSHWEIAPFHGARRSRARASLRNRHQGPSIMGFEDEVEQSLGRPCRQTNGRSKRTTISPHPSSREGHHSTAWWSSSFLLFDLVLHDTHATAISRVHRNSVPSTQMRCMITASRRARATIAFFHPAAPRRSASPRP